MSNFHEVSDATHLRQLREHAISLTKLGGVVGEFMKRKAAIQERYAADLRALVEAMEAKSDPTDKLKGIAGYGHHNLVNLWGHCRKAALEEVDLFHSNAADHRDTHGSLAATLVTQKKHLKLIFQDCLDVASSVANLEAACEKSRTANENVHTPKEAGGASGMMEKMLSSLSKIKSEIKTGEAVSPGPQAHNNYLLQLVACNVQRRKFYEADLPEVLDAAQQVYTKVVDETSAAVNRFGTRWQESATALGVLQDRVIARSGPVTNGRVAVATVVDVISPQNTAFEELEYVAPDGARHAVNSIPFDTTNRAAKQSLSRKRSALEITMKAHAEELAKRMKALGGIEKLYNNYQMNPQFGSADDVFLELYESRRKVRNLQTLVQRNQAAVSALAASGVEAVTGPVEAVPRPAVDSAATTAMSRRGTNRRKVDEALPGGPTVQSLYGGEEEDWDDDGEGDGMAGGEAAPAAAVGPIVSLKRSFGAPGTHVVARFQYTAETADELSFGTGDVIEVTSPLDGNGWMEGKLGEAAGIFPGAYCTPFGGNWKDLALTLYDYDASKADELSIVEGEVLVVLSSTDDGWAEVQREDTGDAGLVPLTYIERDFAKDPATAGRKEVESPSKKVADALAGAFDDLDMSSDEDLPDEPTVTATAAPATAPGKAMPAATAADTAKDGRAKASGEGEGDAEDAQVKVDGKGSEDGEEGNKQGACQIELKATADGMPSESEGGAPARPPPPSRESKPDVTEGLPRADTVAATDGSPKVLRGAGSDPAAVIGSARSAAAAKGLSVDGHGLPLPRGKDRKAPDVNTARSTII
mmetsp:Transcript_4345/g.11032  ORF Transcript_4345/g.11032 Transcript_4345/m.11032 type:complete len:813 (+) Transcript_4345:97-2535(+)|eukprot:CAMPEP_0182923542 /NCGR_PEP_ID=MMETSP0105_2-20130417/5502_1 /TAXON_ID=81532 ORGANISM="Acanthoeca-like sp., Strain 10tr" /NCGR_SAMPLE_ID=MMETSP0105_2 /ASSEMBLY_ACC=CAM_ASM_000205 /LENGTH=812 /DNA_ID=CAMNT_0025061269 /DNA_START=57 /DNA_END=2495 /DNA_ORIENTATION=-